MRVRPSRPGRKVPKDSGEESSTGTPGQQPLLTQRAAIVFIAAFVIGLAAGVLAYLAGSKPAEAVLTGGGAFAAAIALLDPRIG